MTDSANVSMIPDVTLETGDRQRLHPVSLEAGESRPSTTPVLHSEGELGHDHGTGDEDTEDTAGEPQSTRREELAESLRRRIKLVLTLEPDATSGYRALLATGSDGCDPLLRCIEVPDVVTALREAQALVEEAEARWRHQPRFPPAQPKKSATPPKPSRQPEPSPESQSQEQGGAHADGSSPAKPTSPDQLSLFS